MTLRERDFFKERLSRQELGGLLAGRSPAAFFSWKSPRAKAMGLREGQVSDERLVELMLENPYLIRRPIIAVGEAVMVGFDAGALARLLS